MRRPTPYGKYYLLDRVNVGGMAEVFRAKATGVEGFEKLVAIKRILPNIAEDDEFITMFIDEAKIAVQLNHANIAQIYDLGRIEDSYFIALEYVPGKDLRTIFERRRKRADAIPLGMACYVVSRVCEGLDYAHRKKDAQGHDLHIVHRDISPQNILVSYEGEVKIIDFGIAKAANKASKTQAGILKGKFGYMSPEQVRGLPIDRRSDVFSAGIVLYELLTGERLFVGESDFSTLEKVRNVEIMPPTTYNRRIPDELEAIVLKALSREPEERHQHASELQEELTRFLILSGNMFSRKDLSHWMKATFAEDIQREQTALEQFRQSSPAPTPAQVAAQTARPPPPPPPAARPPPLPAPPAAVAEDIETRVYESRPPLDGAEPPRLATPLGAEILDEGPEPTISLNTNITGPYYRMPLHQSARRRKVLIGVTLLSLAAAAAVLLVYLRSIEKGRPARIEVATTPGALLKLCNGDDCKALGTVPQSGSLSAEHVAGKFQLVAEKAGCESRTVQVALVSKKPSVFRIGDLSCGMQARKGALRIDSKPPGARVEFLRADLSAWSGTTPLVRPDVPLGGYEVEVSKPGYFPRRMSVAVREGAGPSASVSLPARRVELAVATAPKGASVVVLDAATNQAVAEPKKKTPVRVILDRKDLTTAFRVEITRKGYEDWSGPVTLDGEPSQKLSEEPIPLKKTKKKAAKKKVAQVPRAVPAPPAEPQYGTLDVNLKGAWAHVHIDGRNIGRATPILAMKLKVGRYRITLIREELGIQDEFYVDIAANRATRALRTYRPRE